ncbi:MAG: T9SS type A sorting domain-containing protein [Bacteroidetes bacterium]|nr:T9SS type A sorting domain-containing protein [Bacteroidota bacterium]
MFNRLIALILVFGLFVSCDVNGQSIASYRTTDWSASGTSSHFNSRSGFVDVTDIGAAANGTTNDYSVIQTAIDSMYTIGGGIVFLPAGVYKIMGNLVLKSNVVIRGEGSDQTTLRFNVGSSNDCIYASGNEGSSISLTQSAHVGEQHVHVASHSFSTGDWVRLYQGDSSFITSSWSSNYVGQIVQLDSVTSTELFFTTPLRIYLSTGQSAAVRNISPVSHCGIEDLRLVRNDATADQSSNVQFNNVVHGWIYGVESDSCNYAHFELSRSSNILIQGCFLHNGHSYGSGGKGYGIALQYTTGNCRIQDNIFQKLRHAVLFQACSNGNVIGYNYSTEPYWTDSWVPSDYPGDVVMHGNYPYFNLVEGNIFNNLRIDVSHGLNGKHNVFLRNRMTNYGIIMSSSPASDSQTFVANEITGSGSVSVWPFSYSRGQYTLVGTGHFEYGNNQRGTLIPSGTSGNPVNSLYLTTEPGFWENSGTWPTLGGTNTINTGTIPAAYRYQNAQVKTVALGMGEALPVDLLTFDGKRIGDHVILNWSTAQEQHNQWFVVKRLLSATETIEVGRVASKGDALIQQDYTLSDYPVSTHETLVYSLEQIDFDGKETHLGVVTVQPLEGLSRMVLEPNPVNDLIRVTLPKSNRSVQYRIVDFSGREIQADKLNSNGWISVRLLPHGSYFLEVLADGQSYDRMIFIRQ